MNEIERALERARIIRADEYADGLTRAEILALADVVERVIDMRETTRPVGNRPVGPAHRTACYLLGEGG